MTKSESGRELHKLKRRRTEAYKKLYKKFAYLKSTYVTALKKIRELEEKINAKNS